MMTNSGESITAVNEGVLQGKLLQVACGYLYTDKKTVYELPSKGRLQALEEVIHETDRKILVFVPFTHALTGIANYLRSKHHTVEVVYGATSRGARDRIFTSFQTKPDPRIIVAHPGCMSHGLTLTAANTIVWYAPITSNDTYDQANARIVRPGQTARTLIVHLGGTPVERITYARLKRRGKMQGVLLELFKQQELVF
jgi:SNF2 family DNA or RNA helicase